MSYERRKTEILYFYNNTSIDWHAVAQLNM